MSVNSLPIIFANPVPTPDPGSLPPAMPATTPSEGSGSFGAHLHHARNPPANSPAKGVSGSGATQQANASDSAASANVSASANASSPVNQAVAGAASDEASQASVDSAASLASAVLGLIGQSTADHAADASATASGDGKGTDKPVVQVAAVTEAPAPVTLALVTPIVPVPLPLPALPLAPQPTPAGADKASTAIPAAAVAAAGRAGASTNGGTLTAGTNAGASTTLPADKFSAMALNKGAASDSSGDDSSDDAGSMTNVSLLAPSAGNTAATALGALPAASDTVAAAVLDQSMATGAQSQDAAQLAALRGVVGVAAPALPASSGTGPTLAVHSPVGSAGFAQELGQQVAWLGGQDVKQAQIKLNPQDLGPLDVKVSVEHGRVDVVFTAQHPDAVTAVQQSLGQLNQMLGGQGLSLGQAMVSQQQTAQQQFGAGSGQSGRGHAEAGDEESLDPLAALAAQPVALGLVDAFA
ncbi:MAG: flagellar hook-length control protein FliK [Dyella sp.]